MNRRQRFINACLSKPVDRPPLWVMRQAGRHLPEYRALKEKYSFHEIAQTPELALEVTMQPLRRYDFDAAIVFTDILVIPEAMGQPYGFPDGGGIEMDFAIESPADIEALSTDAIVDKLRYVGDALSLIRKELGDHRALIGFGGSPWTLATYMLEGGSSKNKERARELFYTEPELYEQLLSKITTALIDYLQMQIDNGVDALQLFDSWGGSLSAHIFDAASARWMGQIIAALDRQVPTIVFSRGMHHCREALVNTGADVLGVDWTADLATYKQQLPQGVAVQGNMDPALMNTSPELVRREATRILQSMADEPGHIFNLGHGISPRCRIECMEALADTVTSFG